MPAPESIQLRAPVTGRFVDILTPAALDFVASLHRNFNRERERLLRLRAERQARLDAGDYLNFLPETEAIRREDWFVAPVPRRLEDRRVEITGPVERKMMINAFNSGARVFMADFEDANSPTWSNLIQGQLNLIAALDGTLTYESPDGRLYQLGAEIATLFVRPRGWHLPEEHLLVDGEHVSGSLFDFGLFAYHNASRLAEKDAGPYFYLPKLESHLEARLWNDVFAYTERELGLRRGSIRATVLIETIPAAFEMDEILWELREHSAGLNAGRWDYIFSTIKRFRAHPNLVLPDRSQVTMTAPFMRAYTELLVKTCHRHGAQAIGGMAAFVPSRRDAAVNANALARVREDKQREAGDGFDGTWVAHPDLVRTAMAAFDEVLGLRANQLDRMRDEVAVSSVQLQDLAVPGAGISEAGLRANVRVGIQYLAAWLDGMGAVAIDNLMEDAATAEISRAQVWQWVHHGARLDDGRPVTRELVRQFEREEVAAVRQRLLDAPGALARVDDAVAIFESVALSDEFVEFLTLPAYAYLERAPGELAEKRAA